MIVNLSSVWIEAGLVVAVRPTEGGKKTHVELVDGRVFFVDLAAAEIGQRIRDAQLDGGK